MRRRVALSFGTFWLAAALLAILPGPAPAQERRVALVVGAERYQTLTKLDTAVNDARAVAARLTALGFEVEPLLDPTQDQFIAALDRFEQRLRGAGTGLFFYAGHGVGLPGGNLLLPVDLPAVTSERTLRSKSINLNEVLSGMLGQGRVAILVLDACRDNPLPRDTARGNAPAVGNARGLDPIEVDTPGEAKGGAFVVFAAQPGRVALDRLPEGDRDPNGLFTRYFLRALEHPAQPLTALMASVRDQVAQAASQAGRVQVPDISDRMIGSGQFSLAGGVPAVIPVAPPSPPVPPPLPAGGYPVAVGQSFRDCPDCPEMVVIPAGRFLMGSPASESGRFPDEGPQHAVSVLAPLAVGKFDVTFAEWDACVAGGGCGGYWPSDAGWGRGRRPVTNVSWDDAQSYVRWLSGRTGRTYRLPTEAEWEYAARAGTTTPYYTGTGITTSQARFVLDMVFSTNTGGTQPVGQYPANPWGLYDMAGNVMQWVADCHRDSYAGAPSDASAIVIANNCSARVLRGGTWAYDRRFLRAASRVRDAPGSRLDFFGFRLARTPGP